MVARATSSRALGSSSDARLLTEVVTQLRRTLRAGIRTEFPWETLPIAQVELLQCLSDSDSGLRVGEIAGMLRLATATVSALVQDLVVTGTAQRQQDPSDRRAWVIAVTAAGSDQLRDWQRAHERWFGGAMRRLSADQQAAVRAALPALSALVRDLADVDECCPPNQATTIALRAANGAAR